MQEAPFKKILIANRGEIALRIIRACKELGIESVAIYSDIDEDSLHVKLADEAVCVGPHSSKSSYLNISNILSAALITNVDAIHPGYGFLSENPDFVLLAKECGIKFIGPSASNIKDMGNKTKARKIAQRAGLPLLPGTVSAVKDIDHALSEAKNIGFPVVLKASSGGGGRGIHVVYSGEDIVKSFDIMKAEALASFGNDDIYIEKFCVSSRHVEVQVVCDQHGNYIHLGERDCTIQRRHQKLIEESPCVLLDSDTRDKLGETALKLCRHTNYKNVGTVEFLLDSQKNFYFMEMNTRIQVEHPVTEMVTGIDLIKEQIKIASGIKVSFSQKDISIDSHAIECRINAEDPKTFTPSPGIISNLHVPGGFGVRLDSFVYNKYKVLPFYDSMIGKLIVHAKDRKSAIKKMRQSLDEFIVNGIKTNIPFHRNIFRNERFISMDFDTNFLNEVKIKNI